MLRAIEAALARAPTRSSELAIRPRSDGALSLFATADLPRGAILDRLEGPRSERPNRYSIQVGRQLHVGPSGKPYDQLLHSCTPNVRVSTGDLTLRALRGIPKGAELCINYLATEARLAAPFDCRCGARWCPGSIAGYEMLTGGQTAAIAHLVAHHLLIDQFQSAAGSL